MTSTEIWIESSCAGIKKGKDENVPCYFWKEVSLLTL